MGAMQQDVLSEIVDERIWASERPVWFGGVRLRARTSVIRLDDGRLLVHSPAPPSDGLVKQIADLGEVSWLVVPNCFHHLGTPAAAAAFPDAKILGPKSAAAKNPELRIDVDIHEPEFTEAVPEFALFPLQGASNQIRASPAQLVNGPDVSSRRRAFAFSAVVSLGCGTSSMRGSVSRASL
jgi:hypothetical protein